MKTGIKKILSLILAAVMILSLGATPVQAAGRGRQGWSSVTYGADESKAEETAVPAGETSADNEAEAPADEPKSPAEEPAAPTDEPETPAEEPSAPAEEPAAPVVETEAQAEEPAEPAVSYPAVTLAGATEGGVTVRVEAPEGALPEGSYMTLKDVSAQDVQAKVDEKIDGVILAAVDITFNNAADKEIQPNGNVSVFIKAPELSESAAEDLGILHIDEENKIAEELTEAENAVEVKAAAADEVAFVNDAFSIYVVVASGDYARLTVNFKNGSEIIKTMYVKKKDIPDGNLNQVLYDPGVPVVAGKKFLGWTDNANWTSLSIDDMKEAAMTITDVRSAVTTTLNSGVADGTVANYYAMMVNSFELFYQNENGNTFKTENVLSTTSSGTTIVDLAYTLTGGSATQNFIGWKVFGTDSPVYKNGTPITIYGDTKLVPAIGEGQWLFFDSNAGGAGVSTASYTAPQFIPAGDTAEEPDVPTRPGYTFNGWFVGPEDNAAAFDFTKTMNYYTAAADGYVYAYAHWTSNPTGSYKVVIWAQKVTDDKNAADADKKYDYVGTYTVSNAVAGTPLTEEELRNSSNNYFEKDNAYFKAGDLQHGSKAFEYDRFEVKNGIGAAHNGVSPDNSTVVNVYYDRALFTILFTGQPGAQPYEQYTAVEYGEDVYGLVNGEYVHLEADVTNKRLVWSRYKGGLALPASITTVKYTRIDGGTTSGNYDSTSVSNLRYGGSTYANSTALANLPIGSTGVTAFVSGKSSEWYLYSSTTTGSSNNNYCQLRWSIKGDFTYTYNGVSYEGPVYEKTTINAVAYTGLYGQEIGTWPSPSGAQSWDSLTWLDAFRGDLFGAPSLDGIPNTIVAKPDTHTPNTTIIFYYEAVNGQYNELGRTKYYFSAGTNAQYNITERVLGGTFDGYKWTTTEAIPSSGWEYGTTNGFTTTKRGNNTYIHIRYKRSTYSIIYMQGSNTLKTVQNVPYEADLSSYENTTPAESEVTVPEGEFFRGWFEDPEGVKRVDWSGTMPLGNKVIYAVVQKAQYHVVIDMDGGIVPENQGTEFWEDDGGIIDDTNFKNATKTDSQGNVYTLVGYYWDEAMTKPWNFDIALNRDYLWRIYQDPVDGWDPLRDADFFNVGNDVGWPNVVGIFRLWAKWNNNDVLSKGGLHIKYVNPVGAPAYRHDDMMNYADMSDVIAAQAPTETNYWPAGKRFDGWQLTEGHVYQPGDIFVADSDDAVFNPELGDNGEYWITLTAVYVDKENRTPTHITWYKNDGSTGEDAILATTNNQGINEPWDIYGKKAEGGGYTIPEREGYVFLGWAKDTEKQDANSPVNYTTTKTTPDFLVYDAENDRYTTPNGTVAEQVAADEVLPYDGLYAIWEENFIYVYHSSTAKLTAYELDNYDNSIWEVPSGYLYGGCYKSYGGVTAANIEAAKNNAKKSVGTAVAVTGAVPYTGEVFKTGLKKHWMPGTIKEADEALQKNVVYYIKEVPDAYLDNATRYVYDQETGRLTKLYFLTATDDTSYDRVYFKITTAEDHEAKLCTSFTFQEKKTGDTTALKVGDTVFEDTLTRGYLGYSDASDLLVAETIYTIQPYWVTPDGVEVPGKTRTLTTGDCTNDKTTGIGMP